MSEEPDMVESMRKLAAATLALAAVATLAGCAAEGTRAPGPSSGWHPVDEMPEWERPLALEACAEAWMESPDAAKYASAEAAGDAFHAAYDADAAEARIDAGEWNVTFPARDETDAAYVCHWSAEQTATVL